MELLLIQKTLSDLMKVESFKEIEMRPFDDNLSEDDVMDEDSDDYLDDEGNENEDEDEDDYLEDEEDEDDYLEDGDEDDSASGAD